MILLGKKGLPAVLKLYKQLTSEENIINTENAENIWN
jgi:hypothetical protein